MAFPWALVAAIVPIIANLIFGGGKQQPQTQQTETTTEMPVTQYRSPSMGFMDPFSIKMMLSNLGSMQGMGMPKGYGGLGMGDWTKDIMAMLEKAWPEIIGDLGKTPTPEALPEAPGRRRIGPEGRGIRSVRQTI